jgi:hypothetical protein
MQQKSKDAWRLLSHPKCHYYVCGDAKMADDVFDVMLAIAKTEGSLSHTEAVEFFDKMKKENRFTSDVWGVQLHFKQAIKQVQHDNYSKAEKGSIACSSGFPQKHHNPNAIIAGLTFTAVLFIPALHNGLPMA